MQHIGIKEVATKAKVSVGTVDRVIHNRGRVSESTREKVLRVCEDLNYHPNVLAQRLAADKPVVFVTITPGFSSDNTYWKIPLEGIQKAAREMTGYKVKVENLFFNLADPVSFRKAALDAILLEPDGILLAPVFKREAREFIRKCKERKILFVFLDTIIENIEPLSSFYQDPFESGYLAGRLLSFHLRRKSEILVVNFTLDIENNIHLGNRDKGLRQFFSDNNFRGKIEELNINPADELLLTKKLEDILHHKTRGIFVTSSAHKVAKSLEKTGKSGLMVVGYDLTPDNVRYLKKGVIDVLLCQKPAAQGYGGMMALFNHFVRKIPVRKEQIMPVDIIVKENYRDYRDF
ncbi:MAG: substrate-binding domain-containing protein [Chlorobi bacterium]|nr:substrate-binding domain-containing protein [Chlorobiota bacterium]